MSIPFRSELSLLEETERGTPGEPLSKDRGVEGGQRKVDNETWVKRKGVPLRPDKDLVECVEQTQNLRGLYSGLCQKNRFSIVKYCSSPGNWIRVDSRAGREMDNACCSPEGKGVPQRLSKGVGREVQTGGNSYLCFCWAGSGEQSWRTNLEQGSLSSYRRASHRDREQLQGKFFAFFF